MTDGVEMLATTMESVDLNEDASARWKRVTASEWYAWSEDDVRFIRSRLHEIDDDSYHDLPYQCALFETFVGTPVRRHAATLYVFLRHEWMATYALDPRFATVATHYLMLTEYLGVPPPTETDESIRIHIQEAIATDALRPGKPIDNTTITFLATRRDDMQKWVSETRSITRYNLYLD